VFLRLSFSTNAFTSVSLEQALEIIARIGYEGVEIMADRPHAWPNDLRDDDFVEIKRIAGNFDLDICNINGFMMKTVGDIHHPSWIEPLEKDRIARQEHTLACLKMAVSLGAPGVSTEPGGPVHGMKRDRATDLFARGLEAPAKLAHDLGIKLLIEPEPGLLFTDIAETIGFIEKTGLPGLGLNVDLGHLFCIGRDPARIICEYPELLEHIHIEDIAADRVHRHLIPGKGAIDFDAVFAALHDVGYSGFVTVELYPYEDEPERAAREAFEYLKPYVAG